MVVAVVVCSTIEDRWMEKGVDRGNFVLVAWKKTRVRVCSSFFWGLRVF